jgi:hypothetical protein
MVKRYLEQRGIAASRLRVETHGTDYRAGVSLERVDVVLR